MIAQRGDDVITSSESGILASDAQELAGITYRQLDYWARTGWIQPTVDSGRGRAGRRRYSVADVVRLALLRHLFMAGATAGAVVDAIRDLEVPDGDVRVVWGPLGAKDDPPELRVVDAREVLAIVETGGAYVVFNPCGIRGAASRLLLASAEQIDPSEVRTA